MPNMVEGKIIAMIIFLQVFWSCVSMTALETNVNAHQSINMLWSGILVSQQFVQVLQAVDSAKLQNYSNSMHRKPQSRVVINLVENTLYHYNYTVKKNLLV